MDKQIDGGGDYLPQRAAADEIVLLSNVMRHHPQLKPVIGREALLMRCVRQALATPVPRVPAPAGQPIIGKLLDDFSALPVLWGLNEPGALMRHSDVFKMLVAAGKSMLAPSAEASAPQAERAAVPQGYLLVNSSDLMALARRLIAEELPDTDEDFMRARAHGIGSLHAEILALATKCAAPVAQEVEQSTLTPLDYRAQGREEALAVILAQSPEDPFADCASNSANGDAGDYTAHWNEDKLRDLLHIGDRKHDAYDRAEAMYWDASGRKEEAEREMRLVERAPFYQPLNEFLLKHEAWDLLADLKRAAPSSTEASAQAAPDDVRRVEAVAFDPDDRADGVCPHCGGTKVFNGSPCGACQPRTTITQPTATEGE